MTKPLNPEKAKKLRPLRVCLAILIAVLIVLILDRLPTSVSNRQSNQETENVSTVPEGYKYYVFNGFIDVLETQTEKRLQELGVTEEEYDKISEYLSKDEIFELETKLTLATELESTFVEANESDIEALRKIFNLDEDYSLAKFKQQETTPSDYKALSDLIAEYYKTLNTVEDYDVAE